MSMSSVVSEDKAQEIDLTTVWERKLVNTGRRTVVQYYGRSPELVLDHAKKIKNNIDVYRSPYISHLYTLGEFYACEVSYYGLD